MGALYVKVGADWVPIGLYGSGLPQALNQLRLTSTVQPDAGVETALVVGAGPVGTGLDIAIYDRGIQSRFNALFTTLYLNYRGGIVHIGAGDTSVDGAVLTVEESRTSPSNRCYIGLGSWAVGQDNAKTGTRDLSLVYGGQNALRLDTNRNAFVRDAAGTGEVQISPTAWTAVTFENGWANKGGSDQVCQYRKIGDIVYLRGTMTKSAVTYGQAAFTLPIGFRPPAIFRFNPSVMDGSNVTTLARGDINTTGPYAPQAGPANFGFWTIDTAFSVIA
jgi:hypothetical protein